MKAKVYWVVLILIVIAAILGIRFIDVSTPQFSAANCPFCNPAILESQQFYEDDEVIALCTYKPVTPGHCLVIPKRHVERFEGLSEPEITHIGITLQKVNTAVQKVFGTSAYLLLQKNGREVGQSVPHVHVHYIPRKAGENSKIAFFWKMWIADVRKPITPAERREIVEKLQVAMGE